MNFRKTHQTLPDILNKKTHGQSTFSVINLISLPSLILFILSLLLSLVPINAQHSEYMSMRGEKTDTIICRNSSFSYSLYLPGNYSDSLKWPVIYSFDPGGNGSRAIKNYISTAEKYGFILAGSNNSANGNSRATNLEAARNMILDVETKFNINSKRKYTTGFSGGSRIAAAVALDFKNITGVIGCGAGMPGNEHTVKYPSFDYIGIIGNGDANYLELCRLEQLLDKAGKSIELRIFDGGHNWPSPREMQDAVEWMQIKAMKRGLLIPDSLFISYYYKKIKDRADSMRNNKNLLEAGRYYYYLQKNFPDNFSKELKHIYDSLLNSKEYKKESKNQEKNIKKELDYQKELLTAFDDLLRKEKLPDSVRFWWNDKASYFIKMQKSKDITKQMLASRIISLISMHCFDYGRNFISAKKYEKAANIYLIATIFLPSEPYYHLLHAKAKALEGDIRSSVNSLEKAIKTGLKDKKYIEKDTAFMSLAGDKRFVKLMEQLK